MFDGLSYPGLRCVLEYLEANKRIHITSRSPALQKFEKSIPLHLDQLFLSDSTISVNDIDHKLYSLTRAIFTTKNRNTHWTIPQDIAALEARKIVKFHFLDGRSDIYVNYLKFDLMRGWESLQLPASLQLKIRKLDTSIDSYRDAVQVVHPSSFPLTELKTAIRNADDTNHDVLKSVPKLIITFVNPDELTWFISNIANLTNTNISFEGTVCGPDESRPLRLTRSYLQTPRSVGACLEFRSMRNDVVVKLLNALKDQLIARDVSIKEPYERLSHHTPCYISISFTSAALIYGTPSSVSGRLFNVKLKIVPVDVFSLLEPNI